MTGSGPVQVHVDFAGLGRVHTELQNLLAQLEGLDQACAIQPDADAVGSAVAAEAITVFGTRKRADLGTLVENLAGCLTYVELAAAGYGGVETTLGAAVADAVGQAGAPRPGGAGR